MFKYIAIALSLALGVLLGASAFADDVYKASDQTAYYCGFGDAEGGDVFIHITNDQGVFTLSVRNGDERYDAIAALKKDTPIKFDLEIYYVPYGECAMTTTTLEITKFAVVGEPKPGSCKTPE
ncbi:MAG: hypothetical protein LBS60_06120 [Deltaproteobacteria bacterium]|jgi:hypothetical protein|nr:hypothetical protein [Deltaproteobacteria bacterium]